MGAEAPLAATAGSGRSPLLIAVAPAEEHARRARLFAALEQLLPVSFQGGRPGRYDARIAFGAVAEDTEPEGSPSLCFRGGAETDATAGEPALRFGEDPLLERPLRGARLRERWCRPLPAVDETAGRRVIATIDGAPAWSFEDGRELVGSAPAELDVDESLRERLAPGRSLAMLALVSFLRRVCDIEVQPPWAAFVIDDPNLHWPSYGHLRYRELAAHARAHAYHVAIAMPPIDGWFAHPAAVRQFREHSEQLSLCVHGNDHHGGELGRIVGEQDGRRLAHQALARARAFARRTGIAVEPVMVPPHERLSEPAAAALLTAGFQAVCASRPYPWIEPRREGWTAALATGPEGLGALVGAAPVERVLGGLAVLPRAALGASREEIALRAFLGQPLILYGHHDSLRDGLDVLADAAGAIAAVGGVRWGTLGSIAADLAPGAAAPAEPPGVAGRPRPLALARRIASEARDRVTAIVR